MSIRIRLGPVFGAAGCIINHLVRISSLKNKDYICWQKGQINTTGKGQSFLQELEVSPHSSQQLGIFDSSNYINVRWKCCLVDLFGFEMIKKETFCDKLNDHQTGAGSTPIPS